jgi:hypothetical protein
MNTLVEYITVTIIGVVLAVTVSQVAGSVVTQALAPITAVLGTVPQ